MVLFSILICPESQHRYPKNCYFSINLPFSESILQKELGSVLGGFSKSLHLLTRARFIGRTDTSIADFQSFNRSIVKVPGGNIHG